MVWHNEHFKSFLYDGHTRIIAENLGKILRTSLKIILL